MPPLSSKTVSVRSRKRLVSDTFLFIILLVIIALAGFNSGNNLLYLIVGVMLGLVFTSIIAARINISRLSVTRKLPKHAFAGAAFKTIIEVANNKKLRRSYGLILDYGTSQHKSHFILLIENNGKNVFEADVTISRRGLHKFAPVVIRSGFPLGLFSMKKRITDENEIIVFPRVRNVERLMDGSSYVHEEFPRYLRGPGSGFYGAREYRHGEEAAYISWKLSAKLDKLVIHETEYEEKRRVCIVLDNVLKDDSAESLEAFERAVSNAASLVLYLCQNGYSVKLVTHDRMLGYGEGLDHMYRMLTVLALIQPVPDSNVFFRLRHSVLEGGRGILITYGDDTPPVAADRTNFTVIMNARSGAENG